MNELDSVIQEFLLESHENLDQLDRDLVALEQNPHSKDELASIFRTIHTIKGTCGFFDFKKLGAITHSGENLLSRVRDGELPFSPPIADGLLRLVDSVRAILANIEATGEEGSENYSALVDQLNRLQAASRASQSPWNVPGTSTAAAPSTSTTPKPPRRSSPDGAIRVDVGLLDKLMNRVGELVLARNQILQSSALSSDEGLLATAQRLNLITTELQDGVMKTRMQPIRNVWDKFPRLVRDLSATCGKRVRLETEGSQTELDRTIIEAIRDPLTHLVRNAVDHGIELPEVRQALGKPAEGLLRLRAFHEGGQVNIEITDDGAGLNRDKICQTAIRNGLLSADQAQRLSDREIAQLIFAPGFSTASAVSDVSGRGVGMDVVKTNIEKVGGTLDVQSQIGRGTKFKLKLPLTLAVIQALTVTSGHDRYVIPHFNLVKLIRLEGEQAREKIEDLCGDWICRLDGTLLPLVHLRCVLQQEEKTSDPYSEPVQIVVLQSGERQFGLVVDAINETLEIIVKPLDKQLAAIPTFAGVTILGDGRVVLVLDVVGLAERARVAGESTNHSAVAEPRAVVCEPSPKDTVILLELNCRRRIAIPLTAVSRLETFPMSTVEMAGQREVVQYCGRILPLIRVDELFPARAQPRPDCDVLHAVICTAGRQMIGLVVHRIVDIVSTTLEVQPTAGLTGITGSAVINGRVTSLVDVAQLADTIDSISLSLTAAG